MQKLEQVRLYPGQERVGRLGEQPDRCHIGLEADMIDQHLERFMCFDEQMRNLDFEVAPHPGRQLKCSVSPWAFSVVSS
ncbi:MAG TPA: hypothetical protein VFG87_17435 [Amycolatopsis sp.]|nr:hypothetical protein [Amycolatopsis sp.]